jgi:hypothetical protein
MIKGGGFKVLGLKFHPDPTSNFKPETSNKKQKT